MSRRRLQRIASLSLAAVIGVGATHPATAATYVNDRFGYAITIPETVFVPVDGRAREAGAAFKSPDGRAELLVVAARNETGASLKEYRRFVMEETYAGARFDYAPVRDTWFVLSGRRADGNVFYERISFACNGRYIYGWRMTYPASEQRVYDRLVEDVHRGFKPGRGEDGRCGP